MGKHNQGGYYIIDGWSPGGAEKTAYVNLPMSFPTNARFGLATNMGLASAVICNDVTKTQIGIATKSVVNLHSYVLAIGY